MREALTLAWAALRADHSPRETALRLIVAVIMAAVAWLCICAFMLMEPDALSANRAAGAFPGVSAALACPDASEPASYGFLDPLNRPIDGRPIPNDRKDSHHA